MRDDYLKTAKEKIKRFSDYLGEKQWFVGDKVNYVTIRQCNKFFSKLTTSSAMAT